MLSMEVRYLALETGPIATGVRAGMSPEPVLLGNSGFGGR